MDVPSAIHTGYWWHTTSAMDELQRPVNAAQAIVFRPADTFGMQALLRRVANFRIKIRFSLYRFANTTDIII